MNRDTMSNGNDKAYNEIFSYYDEIGALLEKDSPNTKEIMRKFLGAQRLIMAIFIGTFLEDHRKIEAMWPEHERRKEKTLWDKIKPGLVEKVIIAVATAIFVLVVTHWPL